MSELLESCRSFCRSRWLWAILLLALLLFTASSDYMSLKSYDDCHYAQKGAEMWRRGAVFTVTWADRVDFQYPPLQFWIVARSFSLLGKTDFAARLPSILMALGIMLMTYRMGKVMIGRRGAMVAVAALLLTPLFVTNARRCQTDIPLTFWTTLAMFLYIEGLARPRLHALMAVPLGAAVLTKSVLGLFPLIVIPAGVLVPALRRTLRNGWLWLGLLLGLALGASWSVHQYLNFGDAFLSFHYGTMVMSRTAGRLDVASMFTDYPLILMEHYQPLVLPALAGLIFYVIDRLRRRHEPVVEEDSGVIARAARVEGPHRMRSTEADLMVVWAVLPVVLYSLSSLRHLRYLFPLLPVYALLTGYLLSAHAKRLVLPLCCWVVPIVTIASTFVFWFAPSLLAGDNNQVFKQNMDVARERLEPGTVLPYNGEEYWPEANPFLYYWDVKLERPGDTTEEVVAKALAAPHRSMVCVREKLAEVDGMNLGHEAVVEGKGWAWLMFPERGETERSEED